jgi:hypothetical protein
MHESAVGQDTQKSWPVGTRGFGLGVIDHPPVALAGTAEAPIRMAAAAVARQTAARPATAGAATLRTRCGSMPDGRGRRFPAGLIGSCRHRAATRPVTEMTPRMMDPQVRRLRLRAVLRLEPHKKLTSQARTPFRHLFARGRDVLDCAFGGRDVIRYRLLGPLEVTVDGAAVDLGGPKQRALLAILLDQLWVS